MTPEGSAKGSGHVYRPDIDGLRAVAVLSVLLFHGFPGLLPGGFVGVDIFFVISGFLITGILHGDLEAGRFSIARFYERRVRRIFPAMLTILVVVLGAGWFLMLPDEFQKLGKHLVGSSIFASNFVLLRESGYFDSSADLKPMLHFWSLAIEEQFYLGWPLIMALLWRMRRGFLVANLVLVALSFLVNLHLVKTDPSAAYYLPFGRFWELFLGAALAHIGRGGRAIPAGWATPSSILGGVLLGLGLFVIDEGRAFPGWWALIPVAGSFLVLGAGPSGWLNRHVLASKPMVWVGLISYPLYLWHWPIMAYLRVEEGGRPAGGLVAIGMLLSVVFAYATYRFVERPVRFNPGRWVIPTLLAGTVPFLVIGMAMYLGRIPPRLDSPRIRQVLAAVGEWTYPGRLRSTGDGRGGFAFPTNRQEATLYLGDSHIEHLEPRITKVASEHPDLSNSVRLITRGGCPPIPGIVEKEDPGCTDQVRYQFEAAKSPQVKTVVVGACWNCAMESAFDGDKPRSTYSVVRGGREIPLSSKEGVRAALDNLEEKLVELKDGRTVFLVLDNPRSNAYDPRARLGGRRLFDFKAAEPVDSLPIDSADASLRRELIDMAARAGVPVLDPGQILCGPNRCLSSLDDGTPVYRDDHHLRKFFVEQRAVFLDSTLLVRGN